jgi:hypothetical protein
VRREVQCGVNDSSVSFSPVDDRKGRVKMSKIISNIPVLEELPYMLSAEA